LTKARVSLLILLTTLVGFVLSARQLGSRLESWPLFMTLFGTWLVAASAAAMNQLLEKNRDARMIRTRRRPLPAGRVAPRDALVLAILLVVGGLALLATVQLAAATVAAVTFLSYVFVYTPLKRITHLSTVVGAVPGALPPLIGWVAAGGSLTPPAWTLFGIIFFWQLPHFLAIAWLYREDYARGGFPMLTVVDPSGAATARQVMSNTVALLLVSFFPNLTGQAGATYFWVTFVLGSLFFACALWLALARTRLAARVLLLGSIVYLSLLLIAMVLEPSWR
jgi:protoheme IX farnesyltransferase